MGRSDPQWLRTLALEMELQEQVTGARAGHPPSRGFLVVTPPHARAARGTQSMLGKQKLLLYRLSQPSLVLQ